MLNNKPLAGLLDSQGQTPGQQTQPYLNCLINVYMCKVQSGDHLRFSLY